MKTRNIIGGLLVAWGVGGLLISLPSAYRKLFPARPDRLATAAPDQGAPQPAPSQTRTLPPSIKVWQTLERMIPGLKEPPPEVAKLLGKTMDITGFLILNELTGEEVHEFYFTIVPGGCIHVPPPPPNLVMHVVMAPGKNSKVLYGPVVLHGKLMLPAKISDRKYFSFEMLAQSVEQYHDPGAQY